MKIPKTRKRLCPYCKTHTEHKVVQQKFKGLNKTHTQTRGSQVRTRKRGARAGIGNLGRFSRPAIAKWKMTGAKSSKKTDLRYTCTVCKKTHIQNSGKRSKKLELV
jgi:large subunit ribosomal protein L44e